MADRTLYLLFFYVFRRRFSNKIIGMKINFTFDHLTYFYEAAKLGSITKASKARCVSQSTVSHGIKKLEEALGVPLIKHKNSFELTEHGSIVFAEAKDVFDSVSHLYSKVQTYSQKPLKLICPNSLSNYLVPLLFAKTKARKLHESLTTISASSKQVITNYLNQGLADLALVLEDPEKRQFSQFQSESLFKGKFNAYTNQVAAQQEEPTLLIHKNDHPSDGYPPGRQVGC